MKTNMQHDTHIKHPYDFLKIVKTTTNTKSKTIKPIEIVTNTTNTFGTHSINNFRKTVNSLNTNQNLYGNH